MSKWLNADDVEKTPINTKYFPPTAKGKAELIESLQAFIVGLQNTTRPVSLQEDIDALKRLLDNFQL